MVKFSLSEKYSRIWSNSSASNPGIFLPRWKLHHLGRSKHAFQEISTSHFQKIETRTSLGNNGDLNLSHWNKRTKKNTRVTHFFTELFHRRSSLKSRVLSSSFLEGVSLSVVWSAIVPSEVLLVLFQWLHPLPLPNPSDFKQLIVIFLRSIIREREFKDSRKLYEQYLLGE